MAPGVIALMIPILAILMIFGIPLMGILTKHQQRMAELLSANGNTALDGRIDAIQRDVAELRDLVHQQTIALDRLTGPLPSAEIRERISG